MQQFLVRRRADRDIDEIADYIGQHNTSAGRRFIEELWSEFSLLAEYPGVGTIRTGVPRHLRGLRSCPVKGFRNYLIFYIPGKEGVEIVRVLHGARNIGRIIRES